MVLLCDFFLAQTSYRPLFAFRQILPEHMTYAGAYAERSSLNYVQLLRLTWLLSLRQNFCHLQEGREATSEVVILLSVFTLAFTVIDTNEDGSLYSKLWSYAAANLLFHLHGFSIVCF